MKRKAFGFLGLALLLSGLPGCGGGSDRPALVPVSGSVMYNAKPIEGATVSFWHEEASRPSFGITDAEGKFQLTMYDPLDGAMPGENQVTVVKTSGGASTATTMSPDEMAKGGAMALAQMAQQAKAGGERPKPIIPEKYGSRTASPLKETVSAENNVFPIQLAD